MMDHQRICGVCRVTGCVAVLAALVAPSSAQDADGDGYRDGADNCPQIANPDQADCNSDGIGDVCALASGVVADCDGNGVPDSCELCADGSQVDIDGDGYLDSCERAYGNFDLDADIDGGDLGRFLIQWGAIGAVEADLDGSGVVNGVDLNILLVNWGLVTYSPVGAAPCWATVLAWEPDPAIVISAALRDAISATGFPWRVRDDLTQIEMLLVPPGTFSMGCSPSTGYGCDGDESPVHAVTLSNAVYVGRYEVTQAQWVATMGANPSFFQGVNYPGAPSRPVERVSWNMVQGFLTATGMRLPTEAEWEFSCRAGTTTAFHSGPGFPDGTNTDSLATEIAWHNANAGGQSHVVGGKAANALGLHDMSGNIWEWVNDWHGAYPSGAQANPVGPATGTYRVLRGGAWYYQLSNVRSSDRNAILPGSSYYYVGFRVAKNPF